MTQKPIIMLVLMIFLLRTPIEINLFSHIQFLTAHLTHSHPIRILAPQYSAVDDVALLTLSYILLYLFVVHTINSFCIFERTMSF